MPDIPSKFQKDPSITFWVILLTHRQTDRQTDKVWQKHYLLAGGNNGIVGVKCKHSITRLCFNHNAENKDGRWPHHKHSSVRLAKPTNLYTWGPPRPWWYFKLYDPGAQFTHNIWRPKLKCPKIILQHYTKRTRPCIYLGPSVREIAQK